MDCICCFCRGDVVFAVVNDNVVVVDDDNVAVVVDDNVVVVVVYSAIAAGTEVV